ncbi:MAG: hypothetical protein Kow00121_56200 [Elainellaceae cyanobacterium]
MIQSKLSLLWALILSLTCWSAVLPGATAAPLLSAPLSAFTATAPTHNAMAKKSLFSFSGKRPTNLGVTDGKLVPCPGTPNCVSSQAADTDAEHKIAPLTYSSSATEAIAKLKSVIQSMERTEIINEQENYLYAEFTSALMGYVDDVEFYVEPNGTIQVRSASRLGQSDLGVNRKRIEDIRSRFDNA